jgi:hypothetical protein
MWFCGQLVPFQRIYNQRLPYVTMPDIDFMTRVCYSAPTFLKELPGGGEPNPKPLHSGGIEHHIRDLQERDRFRRGVRKPEEPKQQPATPSHELSEHYRREQERHSGVLENPIRVSRPLSKNPGEQRREAEPRQPIPAEQQTPQRRRTQREIARLAQDRELRSLADELWGKALRKGTLTDTIKTALYQYPDLPPDEALRRVRNDYQGFSFASGEQGREGQPSQHTPSEQQTP